MTWEINGLILIKNTMILDKKRGISSKKSSGCIGVGQKTLENHRKAYVSDREQVKYRNTSVSTIFRFKFLKKAAILLEQ